jgi:hypothetical protein
MGFGRFLQSLVPGAAPAPVAGLALAVVATALVSASAIWTATRHVARLDISDVLRAEAAE